MRGENEDLDSRKGLGARGLNICNRSNFALGDLCTEQIAGRLLGVNHEFVSASAIRVIGRNVDGFKFFLVR